MFKSKISIFGIQFSRPFIIIISLAFLTGATFQITPLLTNMSLPIYLASLSTKTVSVKDVKEGKIKPVILIDVRTPEEYAEDHINNSLLVPLTDIENGSGIKQIQTITDSFSTTNQNKPTLVLYCTSGKRSIKAYKYLEAKGLDTVVLAGGITAWRKLIPREKDAIILDY